MRRVRQTKRGWGSSVDTPSPFLTAAAAAVADADGSRSKSEWQVTTSCYATPAHDAALCVAGDGRGGLGGRGATDTPLDASSEVQGSEVKRALCGPPFAVPVAPAAVRAGDGGARATVPPVPSTTVPSDADDETASAAASVVLPMTMP